MLTLKETKKALEKYGKYVIQQSRSNLTKGRKNVDRSLYNSLKYEVLETPDSIVVEFEMSDYGAFVDKGVKGSKSTYTESRNSPYKYTNKKPPMESIMNWAKKRRIRFRDEKGKYKEGNYRSIGFVLQKSIFEKGTKGSQFFTTPLEKGQKILDPDLLDKVGIDIEEFFNR